jgi:hypothetical protein
MKEYHIGLCDSDGDGVINFWWDDAHPGISIQLEGLWPGSVVVADFYKRELVKKLKKLLKQLEQE